MALGIVNTLSSPATYGLSISDVSDFQVLSGSSGITIKWSDPQDTVVDGAYLAVWAGTMIIRKEGSEPHHKSDGVIIVTSNTRDQYKITGYIDRTAQSGKTYYYKAFPYTSGNVYTSGSTAKGRLSSTLIPLPTATNLSFTYDPQNSYSPTLNYDTQNVTVSGVTTAQEGGTYPLVFSLSGNNTIWADNTVDDKVFTWQINPRGSKLVLETNGYRWNREYDYSSSPTGLYETPTEASATYYLFTNGATEVVIPITEHEGGPIHVDVGQYGNYISPFKRDNTIVLLIQPIESDNSNTGRINTDRIMNISIVSSPTNNYKKNSVNLRIYYESYKYYTVKIDTTNNDPASALTYADDAVTMTAGSSDWDDWFGYTPVLLHRDGTEVELNPNDFTKAADGTAIDITSGSDDNSTIVTGDVMIKYPLRGIRLYKETANNTTYLVVSMTDHPNDPNYSYRAHSAYCKDSDKEYSDTWAEVRDNFYLGAYLGFLETRDTKDKSGNTTSLQRCRSLSGKTASSNQVLSTFRNAMYNNTYNDDTLYSMMNWYHWTYIRVMYLLKYKNLNSQTVIGSGRTGNYGIEATGVRNTSGMTYGTTTNTSTTMKLFGLEDLWGIYACMADGLEVRNKNVYVYPEIQEDAVEYTLSGTYTDKLGNVWNVTGSPKISKINSKIDRGLRVELTDWLKSSNTITFGGADFTIRFYGYMDSVSTQSYASFFTALVSNGTGNTSGYMEIRRENSIALWLANNAGSELAYFNITNAVMDKLQHFEVDYTHANSTMRVFIDGVLANTVTCTIERLARYFCLGVSGYDTSGRRFAGTVNEFLLLDGKALHTENFTPPTEPYETDEYTRINLSFDNMYDTYVLNTEYTDNLGNVWDITGSPRITKTDKIGSVLEPNSGYMISRSQIVVGGADFTYSYSGLMDLSSGQYAVFSTIQSTKDTGTASYVGKISLYRNASNDTFLCSIWNNSGTVLVDADPLDTSIKINKWHDFEWDYTHSTNTLRLFIDGVLQKTYNLSIERLSRYVTVGGNTYDLSGRPFIGVIGKVLIIDGKTLHTKDFTPSIEPYETDGYTRINLRFDTLNSDTQLSRDSTFTDGYTTSGYIVPKATGEIWETSVVGDSILGFFPESGSGGSGTTYFCDVVIVNYDTNTYMPLCGGWQNQNTYSGIFFSKFNYAIGSSSNGVFGARLSAYRN